MPLHHMPSLALRVVPAVFMMPMFVVFCQEHVKAVGNDTSSIANPHKVSPKLLFEITLHGFLLWASMGLLMPVGILTIRMSKGVECGRMLKLLFRTHAVLQMLSVLLATAGAVMSIKNFNNSFNNHHQRIGVLLYGMIWLQTLIGFVRPLRGYKGRSPWLLVHWMVGTTVSLLGVINIYTGLFAYREKTSRSIRLWIILFTAEISFISFFYILQDKWEHIKKQGEIFGSERLRPFHQPASHSLKQKESNTESG